MMSLKRALLSVSTLIWLVIFAILLQPSQSFSPSAIASMRSSDSMPLNASQDDDDDGDISLEAFQARKREQQQQQEQEQEQTEEEETFDGYALRDVILEKWGKCYDVEFNRVDNFGSRNLYLNIMPFYLGGRRFRHETEVDYLCHLQAVAEILEKYEQIGYALIQIDETKKKPRAGTSPLVAVPIRLDLTREQVQEIIGY